LAILLSLWRSYCRLGDPTVALAILLSLGDPAVAKLFCIFALFPALGEAFDLKLD
jgi:hypothetical protein